MWESYAGLNHGACDDHSCNSPPNPAECAHGPYDQAPLGPFSERRTSVELWADDAKFKANQPKVRRFLGGRDVEADSVRLVLDLYRAIDVR